MELEFLPLDKLFVDKASMRHGARDPDVTDILPTVRKRGVLQPIIVRPEAGDRFGVVAGRRRLCAARIVACVAAVLDTFGELAQVYQLATIVFVGGSAAEGSLS